MRNYKLLPYFLLFLLFLNGECFAQKDELDSLRILYNRIEEISFDDNTKWEDLFERTRSLLDIRTKDSVRKIIEKINPLIEKVNSERGRFLYELINSRSLLFEHQYESVNQSIDKALKLERYGFPKELIHLYTTGGVNKYLTAEYPEALEFHLKSLGLCSNEENSSTCLPGIYNAISVVYFGMEDLNKFEEYAQKAYNAAHSSGNIKEKASAIGNLARIYRTKGEFSKSETFLYEYIDISKKINHLMGEAMSYIDLGEIKEIQGDYQHALQLFTKGLEISKSMNEKYSISSAYRHLGRINHKIGKNQKAEELFNNAIKNSSGLGNQEIIRDIYKDMSSYFENTSQLKKALQYQKKFMEIKDSIVGENHLNTVSELEVKYESQKKENQLLKLTKEQQKNELLITLQNRRVRQLSFGLGGLALLGVLGFFLFKQRLQNKKQQELLLAISETQTEERKRIAQDLHDSIGGSLALTKAKFETAKTKLGKGSNELESALETLDKTTKQVRQISHNLMPGELVRFGLVAAINTLLENVNKEEINAQFHTNQEEERLEPLKEIQLYRIVQEALQNILKHAQAKNLFIQLNKHKDQLSLMIEDDGKGMPESPGEGMGLKNIKQRVQLLKGIFTVDSSPERGTVLNVQIPV